MRVLLVDDEEELVTTLAERLSFRDIDASWATSAEDAMSLAEAEHFDIAILDVKMPRMGGIDLKKRLEQMDPGMKFIFLTGHGSERDFEIGSAQAASYLVKPVNIDALIEKMKEALAT
jgi:DNA-binding response OmpR family regulator